ncbi:hypothetical protein GCM10017744_002830 [Streptomyces antimycoticus]|uniref:ANTAR domain-containing protein n=1 Tax=Streptomyces antimycoticus TaxID=68175 RepID=A0A4D4KSI5_9ACTN|nr:ANTAR domain-containing protein [Streptomyces antimycoticus]GDY48799.1 hypothetical protein SANT12839_096810 [Streptomyces antimycoticus]
MRSRPDGLLEQLDILMKRRKISEDETFGLLRRVSQERDIKPRDIARQICERGDIDYRG